MKPVRLLTVPVLLLILSSCQHEVAPQGTKPIALNRILFGYMSEHAEMTEVSEGEGMSGVGTTDGSYLTTFSSQEDIDMIRQRIEEDDELKGYEDKLVHSKYEYKEDVEDDVFVVRAEPRDGAIRSFKVESSDPDVLEILKTDLKGVHIKIKKLGPVTLKVWVNGAVNSLYAEYPIDIIGRCKLVFYVRDIKGMWDGVMGGGSYGKELDQRPVDQQLDAIKKLILNYFRSVCIMNKLQGIPPGVDDVVMEIRDSVTITDYVHYFTYDNNHDLNLQVQRTNFCYPRHYRFFRHMRNRRLKLQDITQVVQTILSRSEPSFKVVETTVPADDGPPVKVRDTVTYNAYHIVEKIRVDYWVYCDNPYIYFDFDVKTHGTVSSFDEMPEYGPDDDHDVAGLKPADKNYFEVLLNDFTTAAERDSMAHVINERKRQMGYKDESSDEEKDAVVDKMNEYLDEPISMEWEEKPAN